MKMSYSEETLYFLKLSERLTFYQRPIGNANSSLVSRKEMPQWQSKHKNSQFSLDISCKTSQFFLHKNNSVVGVAQRINKTEIAFFRQVDNYYVIGYERVLVLLKMILERTYYRNNSKRPAISEIFCASNIESIQT